MAAIVRPAEERDRAEVLALLGDNEAVLDAPTNRVHVAEGEGRLVGAVVWMNPGSGDMAYLGDVVLSPASMDNRPLFYRLVQVCAQEALAEGFTRASFRLLNSALLALVERDFRVEPVASGWEPNTGRPVEWTIVVDLADAIQQLAGVIGDG